MGADVGSAPLNNSGWSGALFAAQTSDQRANAAHQGQGDGWGFRGVGATALCMERKRDGEY